jgi:eukaryotic-like serine/threonine-protein kinase
MQTGTILQNRYEVVRLIARGGMGAVYEAVDQRLGNRVALKETLVTDPQLRQAFEREARLLAGLNHPVLPGVKDHFTEDGGQFLVMDFIPGKDLAGMLEQRAAPFSVDEVLAWAADLLDALDYLHSRQPPIIHRDIKPQNLKLNQRGRIVLLDFGLAKGAQPSLDQTGISTGQAASIFGYTPQYAPIEQIRGSGTAPTSDLYSLAATLFQLLSNQPPPDALTRASATISGQPDPLPDLSQINPQVSPVLNQVLQQAMAQNAQQRFAGAPEMLAALEAAAGGQADRKSVV